MNAYPRAHRIAVGLTLVMSGLIGLWLGALPFGWGLYRWVVDNNQPSILFALVVSLIVFNAVQVGIGAWVLASRDSMGRISVPWAAGVLLFFGSLWAVRNLSFMLLVVPRHVLADWFLDSPNLSAAYVALAHDLLGVLGAALLVWMILYRLLRRPLSPPQTSQPAA